jgi:hypothetical protein
MQNALRLISYLYGKESLGDDTSMVTDVDSSEGELENVDGALGTTSEVERLERQTLAPIKVALDLRRNQHSAPPEVLSTVLGLVSAKPNVYGPFVDRPARQPRRSRRAALLFASASAVATVIVGAVIVLPGMFGDFSSDRTWVSAEGESPKEQAVSLVAPQPDSTRDLRWDTESDLEDATAAMRALQAEMQGWSGSASLDKLGEESPQMTGLQYAKAHVVK